MDKPLRHSETRPPRRSELCLLSREEGSAEGHPLLEEGDLDSGG